MVRLQQLSSKETIENQLESSRLELLDMGLRANPQLNCRANSQKVLEIVDEKSAHVFDLLVNQEAKMSFLPIPEVYQKEKEADEQDRDYTFAAKEQVTLPPLDVYLQENVGNSRFIDKQLQTGLIPEKLDKSLLRIETEAHNLLQEQGIEVLYLALGFLKWYEDERTQNVRYAPLILVPVELTRTSASEGFKVKYTGDDLGANLTLAAKLHGEYNLKLPTYSEDQGIAEYFDTVVEAIEKQSRWQVLENKIILSLFSFGKFQMYMDLDPKSWPTNKTPNQNELLNRLLKEGFSSSSSLVQTAANDVYLTSPENIPLVKDADSSQLEAVIAAQKGADLIIQGSPGTGKSQTITNIIADFVDRGKKVLFVAQKMAALEVVKKRLDESHLGHAALELHSHKSTKKAVLNSLRDAMQQGAPQVPDRNAEYKQLAQTRETLTAYISATESKILNTDLNYVESIGLLRETEEEKGANILPELSFDVMKGWSQEEFKTAIQKTQTLIDHLEQMGTPSENPFSMTSRTEVSPTDQSYIANSSEKCLSLLQQLQECSHKLASDMGLSIPTSIQELSVILKAALRAQEAPKLSGVSVDTDDWQIRCEAIQEGLISGRGMMELHHKYSPQFIEQIFEANLLPIRQGLVGRTDKWWRFLSSDYRQAKRELLTFCKDGLQGKPSEWLNWVNDLLEYQSLKKRFTENEQLLSSLFGAQWQGVKSDWVVLSALSDWIIELYEQIGKGEIPRGLAKFLEGNSGFSQYKQQFDSSKRYTEELLADFEQLKSRVRIDEKTATKELVELDFQFLQSLLEGWQNVDALYQYARYNLITEELNEIRLDSLIKLSRDWRYENSLLLTVLKSSFYSGLVTFAYDHYVEIKRFDRLSHEKNIHNFRELDSACLGFAQERLAVKIYNSLPNRHARGEMEILMRELGKKSRHIPIRQLLVKAGNAVQKVKPIFMMSPMSISTYLEQGAMEFDVVIFDEASQIPAPDALGALMRGKQVIVVGDSKQMPPSDLFGKSVRLSDEEVEDSATAEMESILSLMEAKGTPEVMLRWHYRSRNSSLIAVSNDQFYSNRLLAFPSSGAQKEARGLIFNYSPENIYSEDGTASNHGEARAIAEAVLRHAKKTPELSLGVVAFSVVQRDLIMMEVEKLRRENIDCEAFFQHHAEGDEFFIKNLENVQGDERDVIFISVCYGRKKDGKINQNFGPINKQGGERRLNVLISRARLSMEVFANLKGKDLRISENSPFGLKSFQVFLNYAETGFLLWHDEIKDIHQKEFEKNLFEAVNSLGFSVEKNVGKQGFHLDIAVRNPHDPDQFLLAIEGDGSSYQTAVSVRDRDRLRASVLSGLGWRHHRVWSTDWYRNADLEVERIKDSIDKAIVHQQTIDQKRKDESTAEIVTLAVPAINAEIEREVVDADNDQQFIPPYKLVASNELGLPKVDDFGAIPTENLVNAVRVLVEGESPILPHLLNTRLANAAGISRVGARIKRQIEAAVGTAISRSYISRVDDAFYSANNHSVSLRSWEYMPDNYRKVDNLCDAELSNALLLTIQDAYTVDRHGAISGAMSSLGFKRVTAPTEKRANHIIDVHIKEGLLKEENERVSLN